MDSVKGKVLINRGDGFQPATSGTNANAGDLLMANAGGSAKLIYPGGCQVSIIPGRVVSVGKQPPCTAPSLVGEEPRRVSSAIQSRPLWWVRRLDGASSAPPNIAVRTTAKEQTDRVVAASVALADRRAPDGGTVFRAPPKNLLTS